jgi:hypothetical protein
MNQFTMPHVKDAELTGSPKPRWERWWRRKQRQQLWRTHLSTGLAVGLALLSVLHEREEIAKTLGQLGRIGRAESVKVSLVAALRVNVEWVLFIILMGGTLLAAVWEYSGID